MTNRDYALEEFFRRETIGGVNVLIGLAEGELPTGARVVKVNSELRDVHQDGALGIVVGASKVNEEAKVGLRRRGVKQIEWVYWIKFDDLPEVPVAIADYRIKAI